MPRRGISLSSTRHTPGYLCRVLVGLPRPRGRPGFNEDRRICPIKTSYKDLSGSALIRKTSNLDFAAAAQPLLIPALYRCLHTVIPLSLSLSDSAFRNTGEADEDLWNLFRVLSKSAGTDSATSSGKTQFMSKDERI